MTKVANIKKDEPYDVYIGRPSPFGNPFTHINSTFGDCKKVATREEAIAKYRTWFLEQLKSPEFYQKVQALRGKTLGCFCKPLPCHGDVIVEYLETHKMNNVIIKEADLLQAPVEAIIHQANCQNTMGSGIASALRYRWPEVYEADCLTMKGDKSKLGKFSVAAINDPNSTVKFVFNMYSQFLYGRDKRYTNYEAMAKALDSIVMTLCTEGKYKDVKTVGIPYNMGCIRGGGNWNIVRTIVEETFNGSPFTVLICKKDDN